MQEIPFVEGTDSGHGRPPHHHASSGYRLDLGRLSGSACRCGGRASPGRRRPSHVVPSACASTICRHRKFPSPARLFGTVRIQQQRPDHADALAGSEDRDQAFDGTFRRLGVRVKQKDIVRGRPAQADVQAAA